jgi:mannose-6-phosphate isomerase-like protein (cupin superfamily)
VIIKQHEVPVEKLEGKPVHLKALLNREAHIESLSVTWVRMDGRCCQQMTCKLSDRAYYVLGGEGEFQVGDDAPARVSDGDVVLVPKGVPYSFSGSMTYLVINVPAFVPGSDITIE